MKVDVAPPGREEQVKALEEKPGIDNPYAVAWASYNQGDNYDAAWMGGDCAGCGSRVPVVDGLLVTHLARDAQYSVPGRSGLGQIGTGDAAESAMFCPGSGATPRSDVVEHRGGSWVLIAKSTGKVLGTHKTKEEAEAQERAVQANKHADAKRDSRERVRRVDFVSPLKPPVRTPEGFLRVEGRLARVGIQEYLDADGGVRRELRLPEEVFDPESLKSFELLPLTNTHPPTLLTADTAKMHAVGSVGEPEQDGDYLKAPILIHDARAIADAESGRSQLSNGYSCELDSTQDPELVKKWGPYDAVQRSIRGNHVALVNNARAGAEARIRLDGNGAVQSGAAEFLTKPVPVLASSQKNNAAHWETKMPMKMKLDGFEITVGDENEKTVIERKVAILDEHIAKEKARADAALKSRDEADKARADIQKTLSETQAKLDALVAKEKEDAAKMKECDECGGTGKVDGKTCDNCDGKGKVPFKDPEEDADPGSEVQTQAKTGGTKSDSAAQKRADSRRRILNRLANARAALIVEAARHLGANEKFDDLDNMEIKKRVVAKLVKDAKLEKGVLRVDGKERDEAYVNVRYDVAIEDSKKGVVRPIDSARLAATSTAPTDARADELPAEDPQSARQAMIARALNANVKKRSQ